MTMLFMFSACHSEKMDPDTTDVTGQVSLASLKMEIDLKLDTVYPKSRAGVDVSGFLITINNSEGVQAEQYTYREMPEIISLPVGNYTIIASSAAEAANGFDAPFYKGSTTFTVEENKLTEVSSLTCTLANVMNSVEYAEDLRALMSDDVVTTIKIGTNSLDIPVAETRKAYLIAPASTGVMEITLKGTIDGETVNVSERVENVKAGQYNIIKFKLSPVNDGGDDVGGSAGININIDSSMTSSDETVGVNPGEEPGIDDFPTDGGEEPGDGEGGDETEQNKPTIEGSNFNDAKFDIEKDVLEVPISIKDPMELQVTLFAPNKIAHVYVTIDSETLTSDVLDGVGLAANFDLAEPGNLEEGLSGLGFPTGSKVIGQDELIFDITQFTSLLGIYGAANHNFIIRVVDQKGLEVTQTLKIKSVE